MIQGLVAIAKRTLEAEQFLAAVPERTLVGDFQFPQFEQIVIQPLAVGLALCIMVLDGFIVDKLALYGIHQKHFSRMQTLFLDDALYRNVIQCADLRGQDQVAVIGYIVTGRTQTVSVQHSTHHIAIGKDNGGRAVPRLHHSCVILIERTLFPTHGGNVLPRLRNGHHHCQRQIHSGHGHKFQRVI